MPCVDKQLDAAGEILHLHEADLALIALEHDAASHFHATRSGLDGFGGVRVLVGKFGLQIARETVDLEVVGKCDALAAQCF